LQRRLCNHIPKQEKELRGTMPIIGDKSRFAVEYLFDDDVGGTWMFGDICFWCAGARVGNFGIGTSLRDVMFLLDSLKMYSNQRTNRRFNGWPARDFLKVVAWGLLEFGPESREDAFGIDRHVPEEEEWYRHLILPQVDILENWSILLHEDGQDALLVAARHSWDEVLDVPLYTDMHEVRLAVGEADQILSQLSEELYSVYNLQLKSGR
jgi:hypothetical protein